ncbi:MAG TPA: glycogen debranching protein [Leptolyngbyaceae cyanobacterium M33_DOE_097]|uniref:Glycogen debranching protein n=1 Tax=Oscillatoriales cyanobacterium SpSt-418 TaxID=2282169 RepID=A0A7C3KE42_9CYAN|nr:glycogen debranching protein [Leptolyngbyaceae cyanobacterium M33_DOE_097]
MVIWVNEQLDPSGIIYACIASCSEEHAKECYQSFQDNLTDEQRSAGWVVRMRQVETWDDVPASALKLD